jgi:omega-6 fatty acid desaturase (delta-12 desaturase)
MDKSHYLALRREMKMEQKRGALLSHFLIDAVLLCAGLGVWHWGQAFGFLSCLPFAVFVFRSFGLMHEAVHGASAKNKLLNDCVGFVSGAFCFLPYWTWRQSHLEHHYWTGNIEKDPVMVLLVAFPRFSKRLQSFFNFFWNRWFPVLTVIQLSVFWLISARMLIAQPKTPRMVLSLLLPVVLWGALFVFASANFILGAILPTVALYMLTIEVVNFPHHLQLPQYGGETKLPIWEQHKTARSCLYPRWFARLVVLNFNYHAEHHMFPEVPWYHLDQLHVRLAPMLGSEHNVDPHFKWILENKPKDLLHVLGPPDLDSEAPSENASVAA